MTNSFVRLARLLALLSLSASVALAGDGKHDDADPCASLRPAAAGGPVPRDDEKLVVRWLGTTNYEISYRGQIRTGISFESVRRSAFQGSLRRAPDSGASKSQPIV
jgi:hypothetical protein